MKTVKLFLTSIVLSVFLSSCGGIDSKIDAYEEACKDKDIVEMAKIANDLLKMEADMTQEQKLRYANIAVNCN
ncbi:MAG: hypothetical protein UIC45_05380 [Paludibacteraceae bacterium]|jgi:outer membrane lipoprotein-sorting protein|nr:hypothetical protein [Paludibacteraceae bacterium]